LHFERDSKNLGMRVLKGTTLLVGARLIVRSFSLLNLVILARLLSPADYGIAALAIAAIATFTTFSDLKLVAALTATDKVEAAHLNTAFTLSLLRGLVIAAALFGLAEPIARFMEAPALGPVLRVLSLLFLLEGLFNPAFWMYQRNLDFSKEFGRATVAQALSSVVTIAAAFYFHSYWAIVIGTIVTYAANTLLSYWRIEFRPRLGLRHWRQLIGFGGWLTLQGIAAQLSTLAPRLLIPKLLSPAALGVYTIGRDAVSLPLEELLGPLRRTFFPGFSAIKNEPERLRRAVRLAISTLLGAALPVGIGMALLAEEILLVLVGGQWLEAAIILQWVAPPMALLMSTSPVVSVAMAMGEMRMLFVRSAVFAVVAWISIYVGLAFYGFDGGIAAIAVNQVIGLVMNLMMRRRLVGEPMWRWATDGWRSFAAAAAMALALSAVIPNGRVDASAGSFATLIAIMPYVLLGALVYVATHFLLWRLAGRPDGFEANVRHYLGVALSGGRRRLRSR
jgi:O-antigen/teichoic acid export membrane protein